MSANTEQLPEDCEDCIFNEVFARRNANLRLHSRMYFKSLFHSKRLPQNVYEVLPFESSMLCSANASTVISTTAIAVQMYLDLKVS